MCSGGLPNVEYNTFGECLALERMIFPNLSSRLEYIIQAGHLDVQNKIQQHISRGGIEWRRGGTIYIPLEVTRPHWDTAKQCLDQISFWIKYYERKEATTLFELALWKAKMDQADDTSMHHDEYRVEVPGPAKVESCNT